MKYFWYVHDSNLKKNMKLFCLKVHLCSVCCFFQTKETFSKAFPPSPSLHQGWKTLKMFLMWFRIAIYILLFLTVNWTNKPTWLFKRNILFEIKNRIVCIFCFVMCLWKHIWIFVTLKSNRIQKCLGIHM